MLYFYDAGVVAEEGIISIKRFNLTTGPASLEDFGPSEFFAVKSMAVYSNNYDLASYGKSAAYKQPEKVV